MQNILFESGNGKVQSEMMNPCAMRNKEFSQKEFISKLKQLFGGDDDGNESDDDYLIKSDLSNSDKEYDSDIEYNIDINHFKTKNTENIKNNFDESEERSNEDLDLEEDVLLIAEQLEEEQRRVEEEIRALEEQLKKQLDEFLTNRNQDVLDPKLLASCANIPSLENEVKKAKEIIYMQKSALKEKNLVLTSNDKSHFDDFCKKYQNYLSEKDMNDFIKQWKLNRSKEFKQLMQYAISKENEVEIQSLLSKYHYQFTEDKEYMELANEARIFAEKKIRIKNLLKEAIQSKNGKEIQDVLEEATKFKSLSEDVNQAVEILKRIERKKELEDKLKNAIQSKQIERLTATINEAKQSEIVELNDLLSKAEEVLHQIQKEESKTVMEHPKTKTSQQIEKVEDQTKDAVPSKDDKSTTEATHKIQSQSSEKLINDLKEKLSDAITKLDCNAIEMNLKLCEALGEPLESLVQEAKSLLEKQNSILSRKDEILKCNDKILFQDFVKECKDILPMQDIEAITHKWKNLRTEELQQALSSAMDQENEEEIYKLINSYENEEIYEKTSAMNSLINASKIIADSKLQIKKDLEEAINNKDNYLIYSLMKNAMKFKSLDYLINQAKSTIRDDLQRKLIDAMEQEDITCLRNIINQAKRTNMEELESIITKSEEMIKLLEEEKKVIDELEKAIEQNDIEQLKKSIVNADGIKHKEKISAIYEKAVSVLRSLEEEERAKLHLQEAIESNDIELLKLALHENEKYATLKTLSHLYNHGKKILKELEKEHEGQEEQRGEEETEKEQCKGEKIPFEQLDKEIHQEEENTSFVTKRRRRYATRIISSDYIPKVQIEETIETSTVSENDRALKPKLLDVLPQEERKQRRRGVSFKSVEWNNDEQMIKEVKNIQEEIRKEEERRKLEAQMQAEVKRQEEQKKKEEEMNKRLEEEKKEEQTKTLKDEKRVENEKQVEEKEMIKIEKEETTKNLMKDETHSQQEYKKNIDEIPKKDIDEIPKKDISEIPNKDTDEIPKKDIDEISKKDIKEIPKKDFDETPKKEMRPKPVPKTELGTTYEKYKQSKAKKQTILVTKPIEDIFKVSIHPLISKLKTDVKNLLLSTRDYVVTRKNPAAYIVVETLHLILTHRTKKNLFFGERTLIEIFSKMRVVKELDLIKEFESFSVVQNISHMVLAKNILFIQFLMDRNIFFDLVEMLFACENYLKECYEVTSVMTSKQDLPYLENELFILSKFKYVFGFPPQIYKDPKSLLPQLKTHTKALIQYFVSQKKKGKKMKEIGSSKKVGSMVRSLIARSIYAILNDKIIHGFISQTTPYDIFLATCKLPKRETDLNLAIIKINELHPKATKDEKFIAFISYCLNQKILNLILRNVFENLPNLKMHHEEACSRNAQNQEKILSFLKPLERLPFNIDIKIVNI